jgi:hypothetical protein
MLRSVIFGLLLTAPTIAPAQKGDTTSVPRELVLALLTANSFGDAESLTIGAPPRDFPKELIPEAGMVLGGISITAERPMSKRLMIVARSNVSSDSALAQVERQLERTGWRQPSFPDMGRGRGGFVAVAIGPSMGKFFCRGDSMVTTRTSQRAGGGSYVMVSVSSAARSACDDRAQRRRRAFEDEIELPTLHPPSGVRAIGSSGSGGDNYRESTTRLTTTLTPTNLVDHFAEQLKQAGWTINSRLTAEDVAVLTASKPDKDGRRMNGTLLTTRLGDSERQATIRVMVAEGDR